MLRGTAALLLLALLTVAALIALAVHSLETQAVRGAIERAARDTFGRSVHYEEIRIGLFPPSFIVLRPAITGDPGARPIAAARNLSLELAVLPLLRGAIVFDSVVIDGAVLNFERTQNGVDLLVAEFSEVRKSESAPPAEAAHSGMRLAVLALEIHDATVFFSDRTLASAVEWQLQGVRLSRSCFSAVSIVKRKTWLLRSGWCIEGIVEVMCGLTG